MYRSDSNVSDTRPLAEDDMELNSTSNLGFFESVDSDHDEQERRKEQVSSITDSVRM